MKERKLSQALVGCLAGSVVLAVLIAASPCWAWLYDGGPTQNLGASIRDGTSCEWAAEPFTVAQDSYATTLGAAVARAVIPPGAGLDLYLTTTLYGLPGSALARISQPLVPLTTQYVYYYGTLDAPVLLRAGVVYAVVLIPTSPSVIASVSWSVMPGSFYGQRTGDYGQSWYQTELPLCVRVDGYPVPEPASMSVIGLGLGLTIRSRIRRPSSRNPRSLS